MSLIVESARLEKETGSNVFRAIVSYHFRKAYVKIYDYDNFLEQDIKTIKSKASLIITINHYDYDLFFNEGKATWYVPAIYDLLKLKSKEAELKIKTNGNDIEEYYTNRSKPFLVMISPNTIFSDWFRCKKEKYSILLSKAKENNNLVGRLKYREYREISKAIKILAEKEKNKLINNLISNIKYTLIITSGVFALLTGDAALAFSLQQPGIYYDRANYYPINHPITLFYREYREYYETLIKQIFNYARIALRDSKNEVHLTVYGPSSFINYAANRIKKDIDIYKELKLW